MNLVVLKGRATSDIELKTTPNGVSVASFTLAVDRNYTPKGEEKQADFIRCVAWRGTAEFISKWFSKGSPMLITNGEIQTRNYEDKNGNKRQAFEVIVNNVEFCGSKADNKTDSIQNESTPEFADTSNDFTDLGNIADDDLPF